MKLSNIIGWLGVVICIIFIFIYRDTEFRNMCFYFSGILAGQLCVELYKYVKGQKNENSK